MKRWIISALPIFIAASLIIGCGGGNGEEEARLAEKEESQELLNTYVSYLNAEDSGLLNQISELYPECVTETEQGKKVDESILLNYVNSYEVELSSLNEYYENLFDANKYPLQEGESYFYSGPTFNEQTLQWYTTPIQVSFTLEGPWDFSQGPVDETLIETTKNASNDPNHADYSGATYVTYQGWKLGTDSYYYSKDTAAVHDHGWVEDITYLGRNLYIYTYNAPNLLLYFPIKIAQSWESNYGIFQDGRPIGNVTKRKTVLSKNRIVVPAGTYDDAYLIQVKGSQVWEGVPRSYWAYIWYVPYIGRVAYISSLDNEPNDVFIQAKIFERLKYTTYAKADKIEEVEDEEQTGGNDNE